MTAYLANKEPSVRMGRAFVKIAPLASLHSKLTTILNANNVIQANINRWVDLVGALSAHVENTKPVQDFPIAFHASRVATKQSKGALSATTV